ncbi:MAG TPA: AI-2E family transporter [Gammaproteobacteria bacterium]|nr:AI-2E family transporter [Gammaproteobacteria bacterium]
MNDGTAQRVFFAVLLIAVTAAFIWLVRGFVQPIFWAVALGIVFFPMQRKLGELLKGRTRLAAVASVLIILLIVVLPLSALVTAVASEAAGLYERLRDNEINVSGTIDWIEQQLPLLVETAESLGVDIERMQSQLASSAVTISQFVATRAVGIGQDTIRIAVYFFLMLYLLYFFMRDGEKIVEGIIRALPFGDERERHLLERFAAVSRATIKGTIVVGIVQGAIGGILFAALGIGAPVLWGVVMAFLSIIPAVGPGLIWLPAAIILIVNGSIWSGIIMIVVGSLVIGLVDNVLRPVLVGRDTRMPDYLILLSTLGGLTAFGISGIVIGPIIAAFFLSVWEMAEDEYVDSGET